MAVNAAVELALLEKRFPEKGVNQCGKLRSDFFCARSKDGCSYEGRLFIMDKALLFVSTYSTQYDLFISHRDVEQVLAVQYGFLPSLTLTLPSNKEHFTNFHNLDRLVAQLKTLDIPAPISSAPVPSIKRIASVPISSIHHHQSSTVSPCPFFVRSGFCPRQPLCKLDHSAHLHPSHPHQHTSQPAGNLSKVLSHSSKFVPVSPSKIGRLPKTLATPKRFHPMSSTEEVPFINSADTDTPMDTNVVATTTAVVVMDTTTIAMATPGVTSNTGTGVLKSASVSVPGYHRSVSLPVEMRKRKGTNNSERGEACRDSELATQSQAVPAVSQQAGAGNHAHSDTHFICGDLKESCDERTVSGGGGSLLKQQGTIERARKGTNSEPVVEGYSPLAQPTGSYFTVVSPDVPKVFNFCEQSPKQSRESHVKEVGRQVFKFTASPSKSRESVSDKREEGGGEGGRGGGGEEEGEEEEVVKSKPLSLVYSGDGGSGEGGGGQGRRGGGQNEEMALLAQQLQLDSDNDSIHGDLDVETQRKILDSLSPQSSSQSGPSDLETGQQQSSPGKRRPCIYFLSGFCRSGLSCPDYHGLDFDPSELEGLDTNLAADQEPTTLPKEVKVHSADHTHISSGDKIILSPEVLVACEQQQLAYPVAFKLTHPVSGQTVNCGVLQFTAPSSDTAYLPPWMMEHLEASEGDSVSFSHVDLPKGTFVRLQPVSSSWLGIPYDKRMAMMEFQLRNFQTLTEGTKVTLTYELNRYTLKVLECKPAKGISILDADITTDIVEPADLSRYHSVVEGQAEHTSLGEPVHCTVSSGAYRHFVLLSLPGQPLPAIVSVEVKMKKGDPDLFLSQACTAPTQGRYTWCCQEVGDSCIHLSTDDKEYDVDKPLYAGVVSLCEDAEFTLCFSEQQTLLPRGVGHSPMVTGQTLRDSSHHPKATPTSSSLPTEDTNGPSLSPLPPGHERCTSCGSVMLSLRLVMHQRHCAQSTYICPHCKAVLPKSAEKKHKYIAHNLLVCACGKEYTQFALHHHQMTDCSKRMVQCPFKWCNLSFPMDQLMSHENLCGRMKVACCLCQEEVSRLELEIHLEAFHSVDTRDLDWTKPLHREELESHMSKQQFSCGCGVGFDFQDDMEVHQLTDCPLRRIAEDRPLTSGAIVG